jgi:hypothetical protein
MGKKKMTGRSGSPDAILEQECGETEGKNITINCSNGSAIVKESERGV